MNLENKKLTGNQIQIQIHTNLLTTALMGRMGEVISTQLPWPKESQLMKENCLRNMMTTWTDKTVECYFGKSFP